METAFRVTAEELLTMSVACVPLTEVADKYPVSIIAKFAIFIHLIDRGKVLLPIGSVTHLQT